MRHQPATIKVAYLLGAVISGALFLSCTSISKGGTSARVGQNTGLGKEGIGASLDRRFGGAVSSGEVLKVDAGAGPKVHISAPASGSRVLDQEIFLEAAVVRSRAELKSAQITVNDRAPIPVTLTPDGRLKERVSLSPGLNVISVSAVDSDGLSNVSVVKVHRVSSTAALDKEPVIVTRQGPTLQIVFPSDGEQTASESIFLVGKVSSKAGISRVEVFVNGKPLETARGLGNAAGSDIAINETVRLQPGSNLIGITAHDNDGNIAQAVRHVMRSGAQANPVEEKHKIITTYPGNKYKPVYGRRVAVTIGINNYMYWPHLEGATSDARRVAAMFKKLGFDEIIQIYDIEATRKRILGLIGSDLEKKTQPDDLVVIYFAGHGQTETLPDGGKRGYIIPVDGEIDDVFATAISMQQLRELSSRITAKHVYYVMDSCYSGLGFVRGLQVTSNTSGYLGKMKSFRAVQMLTAGMEGEEAYEKDGRGLFTTYLLRALEGEADTDGDGAITASEIGNFVRPQVSSASDLKETPQFGTIDGGGEVVFEHK